ncbi:AbrB/MazE/SpoVT family DNA-binding domain-containing protein [Endothiovibrio diazotrophicus]
MTQTTEHAEVRVGPQGRVVIPAPLRRSLGIANGETLVARIDQGRIILERPEQILGRLQARFSTIPQEINLADELIGERREEARREMEE